MLRQQDASEAFSFITETLALPLLTLKMDIFHTGKEEASDDHKFVNERLLEVAVPSEPEDGRIITLEECLETYFNNKIEVKRYLERKNTLRSIRSRRSLDSHKGSVSHIETVELDGSTSTPLSPSAPINFFSKSPVRASSLRQRGSSLIQEHFISEKQDFLGLPSPTEDEASVPGRPRAGSVRQVMMPAFQFFSLLRQSLNHTPDTISADESTAWYTDTKPRNDAQVAAHFSSTRPILGEQ